jgi:hypothetical protein
MPRFQVYATHPLQALAEQGRYFMGLLMERQRQQKEDEYREQELEIRRQREARAVDAYNLQRAKSLADIEAAGYEVTEPQPTKMPEVRRPEPVKPQLGDVPTGEPTALTRPVRFSEELAAVREPVELGTSRYDIRPPTPERALEIAERDPGYVLGRREQDERRERLAAFAETLRDMPEWIPAGIRQGVLGEPVLREYLENQMRPPGGAGDVTATSLHGAQMRAYFEIIDEVQARLRNSTVPGTPDYGKSAPEIIATVEQERDWKPGTVLRAWDEVLAEGEYAQGRFRSTGGAKPPTTGELTDEDIDYLRNEFGDADDDEVRYDMRYAGYSDTQIEQFLNARRR